MTQAFVYKWTHIPTLKWYVGSRTAKGCHPDDGYICSSRVVKPLIVEHPSEWARTIVGVGTVDEMRELEAEILQLANAKSDPRSFNMHECSVKFRFDKTGIVESEYTRKRKSIAHTGKKKPEHAEKLRGRKRPEFAELMKGRQAGANNPAAKEFIFTKPDGTLIHSKCFVVTCQEYKLFAATMRDILNGKYRPTKGACVGWNVKHYEKDKP